MRLGNRLGKLMTETLGLPKDLVFDLPRITLVGNLQITVENHRGLSLYTASLIVIQAAHGSIAIRGDGLCLRTIFPQEISVDGHIAEVSFSAE